MEANTTEIRSQPLENAALVSEEDSDGRGLPPVPTSGMSSAENMAVPAFADASALQEGSSRRRATVRAVS